MWTGSELPVWQDNACYGGGGGGDIIQFLLFTLKINNDNLDYTKISSYTVRNTIKSSTAHVHDDV